MAADAEEQEGEEEEEKEKRNRGRDVRMGEKVYKWVGVPGSFTGGWEPKIGSEKRNHKESHQNCKLDYYFFTGLKYIWIIYKDDQKQPNLTNRTFCINSVC